MAAQDYQGDTFREITVEELKRNKFDTLMNIEDEDNMLLSMGPQHPSTWRKTSRFALLRLPRPGIAKTISRASPP